MKLCRVLFLVMILLSMIPRVVHAEDANNLKVYFYEEDEEGEYREITRDINLTLEYLPEEKAKILLELLMANPWDDKTSVPQDTRVHWVSLINGKLSIYFNTSAENCAGNDRQQYFVSQIIKTCYSIEEIRGIMIYVEGAPSAFPEGVDFSYFDR